MLFFADQQLATFETNTFEYFHDFLQMLDKEHGTRHFDVSEITGGHDVGETVRGANGSLSEYAHSWVKETAGDFTVSNVRILRNHFDYTCFSDFFGGEHSELDADDARRVFVRGLFGCHF
jgi:hypothetical protein